MRISTEHENYRKFICRRSNQRSVCRGELETVAQHVLQVWPAFELRAALLERVSLRANIRSRTFGEVTEIGARAPVRIELSGHGEQTFAGDSGSGVALVRNGRRGARRGRQHARECREEARACLLLCSDRLRIDCRLLLLVRGGNGRSLRVSAARVRAAARQNQPSLYLDLFRLEVNSILRIYSRIFSTDIMMARDHTDSKNQKTNKQRIVKTVHSTSTRTVYNSIGFKQY